MSKEDSLDFKLDLASFNNDWYQPGARWKRFLWYACNLVFIKTYMPFPSSFKSYVLKLFSAKIGRNVVIKPNVNIKYPRFLEVGNNVWLGEGVWIDNLAQVSIGNNVCISQGVMLLTGNHNYKSRSFDLITQSITIADGAWIGAMSVVCPGVTLGAHSIITVGSTITKSTAPNMIYSGNPAVIVRQRYKQKSTEQ